MNQHHVLLSHRWAIWEVSLIVVLFFIIAGDSPPSINEAHYLVKAKHYWNPSWLQNDAFATSGNAHTAFFVTLGWLTRIFDLATTAWIGRLFGWTLLAVGLFHFCKPLFQAKYAAVCVAVIWTVGVQHGNLAGEWIVGGIESKVFAYGLVLLAIGQMMIGRWNSAWVLLGTASAFHVLVGGWSVAIALGIRATVRQSQVPRFPPMMELLYLMLGGAISLFGLLPSLGLGKTATPEEVNIAAHLYVYGRLSHHLNPASFQLEAYFKHGLLIAITSLSGWYLYQRLTLGKREPFKVFYSFAFGGICLAFIGLCLSVLPATAPTLGAKLLRFYWFRMTDAVTPLAAAVTVTGLMVLSDTSIRYRLQSQRLITASAVGVVVACAALLMNGFLTDIRHTAPSGVRTMFAVLDADGRPSNRWTNEEVFENWQSVCNWVRQSTPANASFITPRHQQSFKWYAQRAEFVNWKDVPQDATSLIEWARRINLIFPQSESRRHPPPDVDTLREIADRYKIAYLIVDRRVFPKPLNLRLVYPTDNQDEQTFWIYKF